MVMANVGIQIVGLDNVLAALAGLGPGIESIVGAAIQKEAEYELTLTQEQVPVRTSQLKYSGRVEPADEGTVIASVIAYGGPAGSGGPDQTVDVDYAVIVHEDLETPHRIGKAKYVEDPVREEMSSGRAIARMSADIISMLESGSRGSGGYQSRKGRWLRGPSGKFIGSTG
jgi:hypothetical protein